MTTNNTQTSIQKTVAGVKVATFLSLVTNIFQLYGYINDPDGYPTAISVVLGFVGTALIWQFGKKIQYGKQQALYYWLALALTGYFRWIFIDSTFSLNAASIVVVLITVVFTLQIVNWRRNKSLI